MGPCFCSAAAAAHRAPAAALGAGGVEEDQVAVVGSAFTDHAGGRSEGLDGVMRDRCEHLGRGRRHRSVCSAGEIWEHRWPTCPEVDGVNVGGVQYLAGGGTPCGRRDRCSEMLRSTKVGVVARVQDGTEAFGEPEIKVGGLSQRLSRVDVVPEVARATEGETQRAGIEAPSPAVGRRQPDAVIRPAGHEPFLREGACCIPM